jgi:hypothetical protein
VLFSMIVVQRETERNMDKVVFVLLILKAGIGLHRDTIRPWFVKSTSVVPARYQQNHTLISDNFCNFLRLQANA